LYHSGIDVTQTKVSLQITDLGINLHLGLLEAETYQLSDGGLDMRHWIINKTRKRGKRDNQKAL
jgi:hypothetical protein